MMSGSALANTVTLTMDTGPADVPVNGLSISGVTFGFTIGGNPSSAATYNSQNGGTLTYIDDPVILGPVAGVLHGSFASPTPVVEFGVGLTSFDTLTPGFTVSLFDAAHNSLGVFPVTTSPLLTLSEGKFSHSGAAVSSFDVSFNTTDIDDEIGEFAFDNLMFTTPSQSTPDAGATALLLATSGAGIALLRRKLR